VASIDERIVSMSFENAKFEAGVAQTMGTLSKLNTALSNVGSGFSFAKIEAEANKVTLSGPMSAIDKLKGKLHFEELGGAFQRMESAADRVTFGGVSKAIDAIKAKLSFPEAHSAFGKIEAESGQVKLSPLNKAVEESASRFSVLEGAAAVAFGNITALGAQTAARFIKDMTLGPIMQGYDEYGTKLTSIRTIMSSTGEGIGPVTDALQELNKYSDKTIYSFKNMTDNLPKFTNAGVALAPAVKAIQGISQVAALSGASTEEAAHSMYNLGQAIGQGYVALRDWRSVEIANMGTKQFKEELIKTAKAMGLLKENTKGQLETAKGTVVTAENFTSTLQDQWLTADALTTTLAKYTDENTKLGKAAFKAATEVKTFTQLIGIFTESIGSGWANTFEIIFGNLEEATQLWGKVNEVIGGFILQSSNARNKTLQDWKELGGRKDLIEGLSNAFEALMGVLKPIGQAFRDIFPRQTGQDLADLSARFKEFTEALKPSPALVDALRRIFAGLFAVMDITKTVVGEVVDVIFDLFGIAGEGSGGFVQFLASIGDFLVAIDEAVAKGGALKGIFDGLTNVLRVPLELIKEIAGAIGEMFFGADPKKAEGVASSMEKLGDSLKPLAGVVDDVTAAWDKFVEILDKVKDTIEPGITNLLDFLGGIGKMIADKFANMDWNDAVDAIQTGLIAGIFLKLKQAIQGGLNIDFGGGVIKNLATALGTLTDNLKAMQRGLQVATLLEIAVAVGILAAGITVLSQIPADKLQKAMTAVAIGLAQLVGAIYLLTIASKGGLGFKIGVIAASMILLATAVTILAVAMRIMAKLSWEEIAKGIAGIAGALIAVGAATKLMNGPKLLVTAAALLPIAIALNILAIAMKIMSSMKWEELAKGIVGVAGALGAIALAMAVMPPNMILTGIGLSIVAAGLILLSTAVAAFGGMDLKTMVQGLIGVSGAIMAIAGAMMLMPPNLILTAAGLVLVAVALNGIAAAVAIMGNLEMETLAKGLAAMGLSLLILAGGLTLMSGTLAGAAALLGAAAAFAILGPAIAFMGQLKWSTIIKGLGAMAAILAVLAIAGALASGPITALGLALGALGLGMLVISGALSLFVLALAQLGNKGPKAIAAMVAAFGAFLLILPKLIIDFIKGLVVIVAEIVKIAPEIAKSLVSIASTLLDAIISLSPKIAEAIAALVVLIAQVLGENAPTLIAAGFALLLGLLTGISNNMPKVMDKATEIVVKFIEGLGRNAPKIINAGFQMLGKFLDGITKKIPDVLPVVARMITTFLDGVTKHIPRIVASGTNLIVTFLRQIAKAVPRFVRAGVDIVIGFLDGIQEAIPRLVRKGLAVARAFLNGLADGLAGLADIGFKAVIRFLHGLEKAIRDNFDDLVDAGIGIADAIVDGVTSQFGKLAFPLKKAIEAAFSLLPGWAKKILRISSPSKVFAEIGENVMLGFITGIEDSEPAVKSSMEDAATNVVNTATSAFSDIPALLDGIVDMEPVITPVLDLTKVEQDAKGLTDLTNVTPITAAASYSQAAAISDQQKALAESGQAAAGGTTFNYEQNNYSPESLSDVEIYRQTKNQLSQVKRGLGLAS